MDAVALWTREQHAWLAALGHAVLVPGSAAELAAPADEAEAAARPEPAVPASAAKPAMSPRPPRSGDHSQHPAPARIRQAPPSPAPADARALRGRLLPDALQLALIRASGCDPHAPGMAEEIAAWPSSAQLRLDPAAKRALWPRLRALRKRAARG
ncbi:MAG: alanine acetyltransferase [Pseudoxanthomonas sp.]